MLKLLQIGLVVYAAVPLVIGVLGLLICIGAICCRCCAACWHLKCCHHIKVRRRSRSVLITQLLVRAPEAAKVPIARGQVGDESVRRAMRVRDHRGIVWLFCKRRA